MEEGPQKTLLTRLNELNNPYRVSYEMVARQLWTDPGPAKIQRSRTRDLSRQFRGEKAIDWRVVEIYVNLLFTATDPARESELQILHQLHAQAFGTTVDPDGTPSPEPETEPIDPAYVADLERQLEETRTRAAFATALLVIVQAENTALRGRTSSFNWFSQATRQKNRPRSRSAAEQKLTVGNAGTGGDCGPDSADDARTGPGPKSGRRDTRSRTAPTENPHPHVDPVTAPIVWRQGHRTGQRRRQNPTGSATSDSLAPSSAGAAYLTAPLQTPPSTLAALARSRSASAALRRFPMPEPASEDLGLDILVGREKRRRGKAR